jgi:hypothetical protein
MNSNFCLASAESVIIPRVTFVILFGGELIGGSPVCFPVVDHNHHATEDDAIIATAVKATIVYLFI